MKRSIIAILVLVLMLSALAGCGRVEEQTPADTTPPVNTVRPEDDNGMVEDGNGIIGDNDNGNKPADTHGLCHEILGELALNGENILTAHFETKAEAMLLNNGVELFANDEFFNSGGKIEDDLGGKNRRAMCVQLS